MKELKTTFKFSNLERSILNPNFSKCKIYVAYPDLNRNNSFISEAAFDDAIPTVFNIPIVGEYIEKKENFGDHGGKIEIGKDGEITYVQTTMPYGVVAESAEVYWEDVIEEDGTENKYLVVDGGYLWTGRYPELEMMIGNKMNQSMELDVVDADWITVDDKKVYEIKKFVFSAFCILGTDVNGDNPSAHVEPCFESASIVTYSLDKDKFKLEFNQMIQELKQSLTINFDKPPAPSTDEAVVLNNSNKEVKILKSKKEIAAQFKLTSNQLYSELDRTLSEVTFVGENYWGELVERQRYWLCDYDESFVYVCDVQNDYRDYKIPYSMSGDNVTIDYENATRIKYTPTDWEGGDTDPDDGSEGMEDDVFEMENYAKKVEAEAKQEMQKMKQEYEAKIAEMSQDFDAKFAEQQESVFAMNTKIEEFASIQAEKDAKIAELEQFKLEKDQAEFQAQVDTLFAEYSSFFSLDEVEELKGRQSEFASFDALAKEVKALACDRITAQFKQEGKQFKSFVEVPESKKVEEVESDVFTRLKKNLEK